MFILRQERRREAECSKPVPSSEMERANKEHEKRKENGEGTLSQPGLNSSIARRPSIRPTNGIISPDV